MKTLNSIGSVMFLIFGAFFIEEIHDVVVFCTISILLLICVALSLILELKKQHNER